MSLRSEIAAHYGKHGPHHFVPFVGDAYEQGIDHAFRVMIVGINSYISDGDWSEPGKMRTWMRDWWLNAACERGGTHAFFTKTYREASLLAREIVASSGLYSALRYDDSPFAKTGLYATNAVKVYLGEHANRLDVESQAGIHPVLLVRFHHPSSRGGHDARRASWLLAQPDFRALARFDHATATAS